MIVRTLGAALALLSVMGCDTSVPNDPSAMPREKAPRDWAVSHGKETGAPTPDTPKQHAPNQGGDARTLRPDRPARPDPATR
jgi:hypothetical protein